MMTASALLLTAALLGQAAPGDVLVEPSSGVKFQRRPTIDGTPYLCLGSGIRKKAVFKVYALVFCVEEEAGKAQLARWFEGPGKQYAQLRGKELAKALRKDPGFYQFIVAMPVRKAAELVFVRNVSQEKMKDSFTESLTRSLGEAEKPRIDSFVGMLDRDIKEKDVLSIRTAPDGLIRLKLDQPKPPLTDEKLVGAIWQSYFGPHAVSPSLEESVARGVAELRQ